MANHSADNFTQISYMGAYGNQAFVEGYITLGTWAQNDTLDLVKIPAGARVLGGRLVVATAVTTSTVTVGVKYADGTSTGGTTGAAVLTGTGGIVLTTALLNQPLTFLPFTNDADTIIYATISSPGFTPGAGILLHSVIEYSAEGTK